MFITLCSIETFIITVICVFFLQVFAVGGAEPAADPEVQEAVGGTFSTAGETQLLDGHHRGSHAGNHQAAALSGKQTRRGAPSGSAGTRADAPVESLVLWSLCVPGVDSGAH